MNISHEVVQRSTRRATVLRAVALLGIAGASVGAASGSTAAAPLPSTPLCGLASLCDAVDDGPAPDDSPLDLDLDVDLDVEDPKPVVTLKVSTGQGPTTSADEGAVLDGSDIVDIDVRVDLDTDRVVAATDPDTRIAPDIVADVTIADIGLHAAQDLDVTIRPAQNDRGLVGTVDSVTDAHAETPHNSVDVSAVVCGVQVVVAGTAERTCTTSPRSSIGSGGDRLTDIDVAATLCGLNVAIIGTSNARCVPAAGGNGDDGDALIDIDIDAVICGIQIAVFGSADTECQPGTTGTDPGCIRTGRLCEDVDVEHCGTGVAIAGSASTTCPRTPTDTPTDNPTDTPTDNPTDSPTDSVGVTAGGPSGHGGPGRGTSGGPSSFVAGSGSADSDTGGGRLPITGGSVALMLFTATALGLVGFGLTRGASWSSFSR